MSGFAMGSRVSRPPRLAKSRRRPGFSGPGLLHDGMAGWNPFASDADAAGPSGMSSASSQSFVFGSSVREVGGSGSSGAKSDVSNVNIGSSAFVFSQGGTADARELKLEMDGVRSGDWRHGSGSDPDKNKNANSTATEYTNVERAVKSAYVSDPSSALVFCNEESTKNSLEESSADSYVSGKNSKIFAGYVGLQDRAEKESNYEVTDRNSSVDSGRVDILHPKIENGTDRNDIVSSSKLTDEFRNLKCHDGVSSTTDASHTYKMENGGDFNFLAASSTPNFSFGTSTNNLSKEMTKLNIGSRSRTKFQGLKKDATRKFDESNKRQDHNDLRNGAHETNTSIFGSKPSNAIDVSSLHDSVTNSLPVKMTQLNIGTDAQSSLNCNDSTSSKGFIFGSATSGHGISGQNKSAIPPNTGNNFSADLPDLKKVMKDEGPQVFSFGAAAPSYSEVKEAANALHDRMRKLSITRRNAKSSCNRRCLRRNPPKSSEVQSKADEVHGSSTQGSELHTNVYEPCSPTTPLNMSDGQMSFHQQGFSFGVRGTHEGTESTREHNSLKQDIFGLKGETLYNFQHQKMVYRDKKGESKRKKRASIGLSAQRSASQNGFKTSPDPEFQDYSPMECSPCPVTASDGSMDSLAPHGEYLPIDPDHRKEECTDNSNIVYENLVSATEQLTVNGYPLRHEGASGDSAGSTESSYFSCASTVDGDAISQSGTRATSSNEYVSTCSDFRTTTLEDESKYSYSRSGKDLPKDNNFHSSSDAASLVDKTNLSQSYIEGRHDEELSERLSEGSDESVAPSSSGNFSTSNFMFTALPSEKGPIPKPKQRAVRRFRTKIGQSQYPYSSLGTGISLRSHERNSINHTVLLSQNESGNISEALSSLNLGRQPQTVGVPDSATRASCEKWRKRGNEAYACGHYSEAEEFYTRGVELLLSNKTIQSDKQLLVLCYSNRAASRMSLGRIKKALHDCLMAESIDSSFLRAKLRAANCLLALGDIGAAMKRYEDVLKANNITDLETKILSEASDGLANSQRVADYISKYKEHLQLKEIGKSLEYISSALKISYHSDAFMEMKAEALLMIRRYEDVIQLCEDTLESALINSVANSSSIGAENMRCSDEVSDYPKLWRVHLTSKSYFLLGKLEKAIDLLKKYEPKRGFHFRDGTAEEVFSSLSATMQKLLDLKAAGNVAFQAGKYMEAVEHYTAALTYNSESRPFSAICLCNRAAAYQALAQITDAIADCSRAIVLDPYYSKALSRRSTLYEMIRDYVQAANDLQRLIRLLEELVANQSEAARKGMDNSVELERSRARLHMVENEAKEDVPLDMYLILGIESSSSAADVKKAYRKAALRHHPDKAVQLLAKNENADDAFYNEISKDVYNDADHLFKTIGVAYNVLSDPDEREAYDKREERRNLRRSSSFARQQEQHFSKDSPKNGRGHWRTQRSSSYSKW